MDESLAQGQRVTEGRPALTDAPWRALAVVKRAVITHRAETACACLLLIMTANLLSVISRKSITNDETVLIPSAYYHLVAGEFQLVHEHPPLCKILAAVPLLFIQPDEAPAQEASPAENSSERAWRYQERFWQDNRARFETISYWSRVPMIALTLALGALVFVYARQLFGPLAAVLAVALFSLEPTVLAHGRVVQTDIPAALGYLSVFFTLHNYVREPTRRRAVWVGLATGIALLSKFSMVIVGPILVFAALALAWVAPRWGLKRLTLASHAAVASAATLLVLNAAYYFYSRPLAQSDVDWVVASFPVDHERILWSVRVLSITAPTDFLLGIYWQLWHSGQGHNASLLGMHSQFGWWYYFPVAFTLKTTIPFLILSVASLAWGLYELARRRDKRFLALIIPLALYVAFVMLSRINIGVRYLLPAYPFLFILGGAFLARLLRLRRGRARFTVATAAVLLLCWVGVEAVRAFPDHMTYMNQLAWRHPHWYYLSDSNVEWGDDVRDLAQYLHARGETKVRAALLGGFRTLGHYDVEYLDAMAPPGEGVPETRYAAIGASFLNGSTVPMREVGGVRLTEERRRNFFDAYRRRTPEAVFGGSIYLFRERE